MPFVPFSFSFVLCDLFRLMRPLEDVSKCLTFRVLFNIKIIRFDKEIDTSVKRLLFLERVLLFDGRNVFITCSYNFTLLFL